ncbi:anthranilate synthase / indole-3-glycerol phosphate synthase [Cytospora paraplurivora]|uniref:Anthranilate synthase / indole-3-glycerol phosphate synthase n=1 Tax=Cytospora paraplurivora TaxID=2898453 RepID=A0AAN9U7M0_9PEZI
MSAHLHGVVVCVVGDLHSEAGDPQWTNENIKGWLEPRGGKFVDEMDESVTHLLCSRKAFEANSKKVRYARRKKCEIVTYEWLDDTILLHDQLKRKAPPSLYHPGEDRPEEEILALYRKNRMVIEKARVSTDISSPPKKKDQETTAKAETQCPASLNKKQRLLAADNGKMGDSKPTGNQHSGVVRQKPRTGDGEKRRLAGIPHALAAARTYSGPKPASSMKRKRSVTVYPQPLKAARFAHKKTAAFDDINNVRAARS